MPRRILRAALCVLMTECMWPQAASSPSDPAVLEKIRAHMADNLRQQPNYTCLETIERTRRPVGGELQSRDLLRLEVALIDGKEMFGWPGSQEFQDPRVQNLVTFGTFGTGNFAGIARAVFSADGAEFNYAGESTRDGRTLQRWVFRLPAGTPGQIHLKVYDQDAVLGFRGTFDADPKTLDVVRLEVTAPDVSRESWVSLAVTMDYVPQRVGQQEVLLPWDSDLHVIALGRDDENHVRLVSCQQYAAQSDLRFGGEPVDLPKQELTGVHGVELPINTDLQLTLLDGIDLADAAAGDSIRAELSDNLKWQGKVLVPKGAIARGRLTRAEHYQNRIVIGFMFQDLEWPGGRAPMRLTFIRAKGFPSVQSERNLVLSYGLIPAEGAVMMQPARKRIDRGVPTYWRTGP